MVYGKYDKHDTGNQHNVCHVHIPLKNTVAVRMCQDLTNAFVNLMFIGPCIIVIVEELKTNLIQIQWKSISKENVWQKLMHHDNHMSRWWVNFMGREACTLMLLPSFATPFKTDVTQLSVTELLMSTNSTVFKPSLYMEHTTGSC